MPHTEKVLDSELIFEGKVIKVTKDTVQLEDGNTGTREIVHHNGGASVIALTENEEIFLVKQYRHAFRTELLEIPAGKLNIGEDPFEAAKRELTEEAGVTADDYIDLGYIIPTCGYCTEKIYIYAAKNLHIVPQNLDEDEFLDVIKMPLDEAYKLCINGEIADSKTVIGILKLYSLHKSGQF